MNRADFESGASTLLARARALRSQKGESYSGVDPDEDAFGNFRRISALTGMSPQEVALIYMLKHVDSITTIVRGGKDGGEGLSERIADALNYLLFLGTLDE